MGNNKDDLQRLIDGLKKYAVFKGYVITDEEIAGKLGISIEDLHAYTSGERAIPDGLFDSLISAYGIQIKPIQHIVAQTFYYPEDEDDDIEEEDSL